MATIDFQEFKQISTKKHFKDTRSKLKDLYHNVHTHRVGTFFEVSNFAGCDFLFIFEILWQLAIAFCRAMEMN